MFAWSIAKIHCHVGADLGQEMEELRDQLKQRCSKVELPGRERKAGRERRVEKCRPRKVGPGRLVEEGV